MITEAREAVNKKISQKNPIKLIGLFVNCKLKTLSILLISAI
jgi:hypothetical protein